MAAAAAALTLSSTPYLNAAFIGMIRDEVEHRTLKSHIAENRDTTLESKIVYAVSQLALGWLRNGDLERVSMMREALAVNQIFSECIEVCYLVLTLQSEETRATIREKLYPSSVRMDPGGTGMGVVSRISSGSTGGTWEPPEGVDPGAHMQYRQFNTAFGLLSKYNYGVACFLLNRIQRMSDAIEDIELKAKVSKVAQMLRNADQAMEKLGSAMDRRPDTLLRECEALFAGMRVYKGFPL